MNKNLVILVLVLITLRCSDSVSPDENIVYSTSFENQSELSGWIGLTEVSLRDDAPKGCGSKSVFISGGCVVPHAYYCFEGSLTEGNYQIECWGKKGEYGNGGTVGISCNNDEAYISFGDSIWTHSTSEIITVSKSDTVFINMISGGFFPSSMLVDNVVFRKVE